MQQHLFIGGEWKEAQAYRTLKSPYSGEVIAEVAEATAEDANAAIQVASDAHAEMRAMSAQRRSAILEKLAETFESRRSAGAGIKE